MRYVFVGPHVLSKKELKDLVRFGYIGATSSSRMAPVEFYVRAKKDLSDGVVGRVSGQEAMLGFIERMADLYTRKAMEHVADEIQARIEHAHLPLIPAEGAAVMNMLKDPKKHHKYLRNELEGVVDNWKHRWKTIVKTELNRAANYGAAEAIVGNNPGKKPEDILVYKMGSHNYSESCDECKKFWFLPDGRPRVYKLSELVAGGSNVGKKKHEWRPGLDSTHPNCVHRLHELRTGYGFDASGRITYVGKDHDEKKAQALIS